MYRIFLKNLLILFIFLICLINKPLQSKDFSDFVRDFEKIGISNKSIGVSIVQIPTKIYPTHSKSFGINQGLSFNPASTIKLLTTRVAYDLMGKNHRFETTLTTNGKIIRGVLYGDIFFIGGGDPKLVIEDIEQIVNELRGLGLNEIKGDWVVDDSLFDNPVINPSSFDGQPMKPYNVGPNAAMINFKASEITINNLKRNRFDIELKPALAGIKVIKKLKRVRGGCYKNMITTSLNDNLLRIFGKIGEKCKKYSFYASLMNHYQFGFSVFKKAWVEAGGKISGSALVGKNPKNSKVLVKWKSPRSLVSLIKDINTMSNNPMARTLFLYLSVEPNYQASISRSRKVIHKWLVKRNFLFPELVVHNGSGLSRKTRISADSLTYLLIDALADSGSSEWLNTLPKVGLEGTVSQRFNNKSVVGNAWLKTGSLKGVQAYSGYIRTARKNWFAATILINSRNADKAKETMDDLVEWVYQNQ